MSVEFAPHLVEAVVRRQVDLGLSRARETFHRLYDELVEMGLDRDPERLESLHQYLFQHLGLHRPIREVVGENPQAPPRVRVGPADRLEGCFLPEKRDTVIVRLRPHRFDDVARLRRYLRNEWIHVLDMLDPDFGFPESRTDLDPPQRDRYSLLWEAYGDARIVRSGREPHRSREEWLALFERAWPPTANGALGASFEAFWLTPALTHPDLMEIAQRPRSFLTRFGDADGCRGMPGDICPLCSLPSFSWVFLDGRLTEALAQRISEDFPRWNKEEGACERCVELYEVRTGVW